MGKTWWADHKSNLKPIYILSNSSVYSCEFSNSIFTSHKQLRTLDKPPQKEKKGPSSTERHRHKATDQTSPRLASAEQLSRWINPPTQRRHLYSPPAAKRRLFETLPQQGRRVCLFPQSPDTAQREVTPTDGAESWPLSLCPEDGDGEARCACGRFIVFF